MLALDARVGVTEGATFTWADQSGNGNDATQTTAAAQPTAATNVMFGDVVRFDGTDDALDVSFSTNGFWTVIAVFSLDSTGTQNIIDAGTGRLGLRPTTTLGEVAIFDGTTTNLYGSDQTLTQHLTWRQAGTQTNTGVYRNGVELGTGATLGTAFGGTIKIGSNYLESGGYFDGDLAALFVWDRALSAGERAAAWAVIDAQWPQNAAPPQSLAMSLDARVGVTEGATFTWADQSANGYDATQTTAARQPSLVSDSRIPGGVAVRFDRASDHWLDITGASFSGGRYTFYVVGDWTPDDVGAESGYLLDWLTPRTVISVDGGGSSRQAGVATDGTFRAQAGQRLGPTITRYTVAATDVNGTKVHRNGVELATGTATDTDFGATGAACIGARYDGASQHVDGDVAMILIYEAAHSDGDAAVVEAWIESELGYFLPYQGLEFMLDARVGVTEGATFSWESRAASSSLITATQATAANQPTLTDDPYLGEVVQFDGTDDHLDADGWGTASNDWTFYTIMKSQGLGASRQAVLGIQTGPLSPLITNGSGTLSTDDGTVQEFGEVMNTARVFIHAQLATLYAGYQDWTLTGADNVGTTARAVGGTIHVGADSAGTADYLDANVAAILAYSAAHGDAERAAVRAYVEQEWFAAVDPLPATGDLLLHLDAGIGASDNGTTFTWLDQSGNGNDVTETATNTRPAITTDSGQFGDVIRFDGVNDHAVVSGLSTTDGNWTVIAVLTLSAGGSNQSIIDAQTGRVACQVANTSNQVGVFDGGTRNLGAEATGSQMLTWTQAPGAGGLTAYRGAEQIGTSTSSGNAFGGTTILGGNYLQSGAFFGGDLAGFFVWDKVLSAAELAQAWRFLANKWNL